MCNLSDRIEQQGIQKGIQKGRIEGRIEAAIELVAKRPEFSIEQALELVGITQEQYEEYLKNIHN